ncbi:hypothetical protein C0995_011918 [Termitomyces sp. Mi166|nr:hypothetical protein C0995_011918 [Termitomyces sp. Mi166\
MSSRASLSATNLAVHHHYNCDLYLHNVYHRPEIKNSSTSQELSELTGARFKRGIDWESYLFTWLDRQHLLLTVPSSPLDAAVLYENIQADTRDHFFIAGLSFLPPQEMLDERFHGAGKNSVKFGLAKPDLLEIFRTQDGIKWKVIDAKVSSRVKTSHHVQIYFYTMCLVYILPRDSFYPEGSAAIWLPPSEGFDKSPPSLDDLKSIENTLLASSLEQFFFEKLPDIIAAPIKDIEWHYNPQCRGCPYEQECKMNVLVKGELGSMPNISLEDARLLKGLLRVSSNGVERDVSARPLTDIEDLHKLIAEPTRLEELTLQFPSMVKRCKRILALPKKNKQQNSPVVQAARTRSPQVKLQRNLTLPRYEDVAVIMSLVSDYSLASPTIERYVIEVVSHVRLKSIPRISCGSGLDLVPTLSLLITNLIDQQSISSPSLTTQFYVWSASELSALQQHLISTALTSTAHDNDVRVCIGALAQGASLLHTTYQPVLLSGALLSFLTLKGRSRSEHIACLERMGLSTEGSTEELRQRVDQEIRRLQLQSEGGHATTASTDRAELGQMPRVTVLQREVEHLIALPVPGYWDLPECASALLPENSPGVQCPTSDEIMTQYRQDTSETLNKSLEKRNLSIRAVLQDVRRRISDTGHSLLVNTAKVLSSNFMDLCRQEHIRKLFFVQQFEVLTKLGELWRARIEGCPDAPVLEYVRANLGVEGTNTLEHIFRLVSGTLDMPTTDKNTSMYDKIIVLDEDDDLGEDIPVEALFDDLAISGLVFPLSKFVQSKWDALHPTVQKKLWVADILNMEVDGNSTKVVLHAWGRQGVKFIPGCKYRISPRLVDFNTSKTMAALLETDLLWGSAANEGYRAVEDDHRRVPLLQMIADPDSFGHVARADELFRTGDIIQRLFRNLKNIDVDEASSLILKPSQQRAAQKILSHRLSVIWGPPGTGKTYTIALSLLRMFDAQHRLGETGRKIVFVTGMTHAAIDAVRNQLRYLMNCYRAIKSLEAPWLNRIQVEQVSSGSRHTPPPPDSSLVHIYFGTTYQFYNFTKRHSSIRADCVVVDEAGQLGLSSIALVLRAVSTTAQIIIAGDSEQLAPILSAQYPQIKGRPIFGSILDCLMYTSQGQGQPTPPQEEPSDDFSSLNIQELSSSNFVQLTENFRLNADLGDFVSTIYSRAFKPQKVQARQLGRNLKLVENYRLDDFTGIQPDILNSVQTFLLSLSKVMLREPQTVLIPPAHAHLGSLSPTPTSSLDAPPPRAISLALVRLDADSASGDVGYETHVRGEAAVAAGLVAWIRRCAAGDDVFVATPHRVQREAVRSALGRVGVEVWEGERRQKTCRGDETFGMERLRMGEEDEGRVRVDTIERLQGSEASFVICLFTLAKTSTPSSLAELGFLLDRRRLNVAMSRAKTLCVVVASGNVLRPGVGVLKNEEAAKGYAFLRAFEERAWGCEMRVDLDGV